MPGLETYDAIMLLSYGGPDGPDDVLPFMRNATRGRGIPDERMLQVAAHYKRFGGVSPINACNQRLIADLSAELGRRGHDIPVGWGNRNWHPFVSEGLDELAQAGARRILVLPSTAKTSPRPRRPCATNGGRSYWGLKTAPIIPTPTSSWTRSVPTTRPPAWRARRSHPFGARGRR